LRTIRCPADGPSHHQAQPAFRDREAVPVAFGVHGSPFAEWVWGSEFGVWGSESGSLLTTSHFFRCEHRGHRAMNSSSFLNEGDGNAARRERLD
jgi:hypothetical protein